MEFYEPKERTLPNPPLDPFNPFEPYNPWNRRPIPRRPFQ